MPVVLAMVRKGDFDVNLSGLGTVTAQNTVTVRSRVDGQILRVAFTEGQFVHEGDLLVEIDPRSFQVQLTQAEGQRAKDEAALKNARADLQRFRTLLDQGILPRQQLDSQTALVDQFEAAVRSDQGQVDNAKLNLAYCRITAPISGKAGLRQVDAGNMVRAADPNGLLTLTQVQPITVLFSIPADAIPQVAGPLRAGRRLAAQAYDRDFKAILASGHLLAVDNQIDATTGTLRLKALFPNEDSALFPNQFVNVRLTVETLKGATLVPTAAIQRNAQASYVYVLNKADGTVELRPLVIRSTEGDEAVVLKGLAPGEQVVIEGVEKLRPGSKVSVVGPPEAAVPGKGKP
ncbi:MAG: MdtA/MuxA family multidrug efflux RND transporter periplasmic adaptor subunit [Holophagaceae bacterium]|nr:MdtA/MuxA family multidrug efflux RND transporter periplasmic adaptor subunit [Holophagaceae bacterium]